MPPAHEVYIYNRTIKIVLTKWLAACYDHPCKIRRDDSFCLYVSFDVKEFPLNYDIKYSIIMEGDMPSVEKIIEKMQAQPNGIRPEEADKTMR